jgi:transposase
MSHPLSPSKRGMIMGMLASGLSQRTIANRLGVSKGALYRATQRQRRYGSQQTRPRSGRPKAMDARDHRRLAREIILNPGKAWEHFASIFGTSNDTVRKAANSMGFYKRHKRRKPFLTPKAIAKRLQWVKDNKDQDWRRVIFTDESAIEMGLDIAMNWTIRRVSREG